MNIYLLIGSFNPPHNAHVQLALWALTAGADEVWAVVSPQNPLKNSAAMAPLEDRVAMTQLALHDVDKTQVLDFEKELPEPHYTLPSVQYLIQKYPDNHFSILCGTDIIAQLPQWHCIDELRRLIDFVEYPRATTPTHLPQFEVSSSQIRADLQSGADLQQIDPKVAQYIASHDLYLPPLILAQKQYANAQFGQALNTLRRCAGTADQSQADTLALIITNILSFRNTDLYNP